ncbi:MAG: JAB domain-containing protein [Bacteroidetes bacterium]|nr:JAB domain-containing protein [Bacteroidota bacterium]
MRGDTIPDLLDSVPDERAMLVKEIACRYGEKRILGQSFNSARQVYEHFKIRLGTARQEEFNVLLLDNKHRVIHEKMITLGTLNQSLIHPREIFAPAIELRAAAIILIHNHPSNDTNPSNQDIEITKRLCQVSNSAPFIVEEYEIDNRRI